MKQTLTQLEINGPDMAHLERITGEAVKRCYQCGNCTAGCPVSFSMDLPPTKMIRMLQLGKLEEALGAESMWKCVSCLQCISRCPQTVSAASLYEGLRQLTLRRGEDHEAVEELPFPFLKGAPQQAIVSGFRKLVS